MASAHHQPPPSYPLPPMQQSEFRLPSLKDLNFAYRPPPTHSQEQPPSSIGSAQAEHSTPLQNHISRHEWSRGTPAPAPSHSIPQHHAPPTGSVHDHPLPPRQESQNYGGMPPPASSANPLTPVRDEGSQRLGPLPRSGPPMKSRELTLGALPRTSHVS